MLNSLSPLIEFQNVTLVRGGRKALNSITLRIGLGEHVAIVGPNGSGKSSLIKTIMRECHPLVRNDSSIKILGYESWNIFELRPLLGIVSPDWMQLCTRDITGREAILTGFFSSTEIWSHNHVTVAMERKTEEILALLEIEHLTEYEVSRMSSGEARRVLIGRALVHNPKALILDEPTTSLDLRAVHEFGLVLRKIAQSGTSIVLVTHYLPDIIPEISRVILMKDGHIFRDGPKEEVLTSEYLTELFRMKLEVVKCDGYYTVV